MPDISPLYFTVDSAGVVQAVFPGGLIVPATDGWNLINVPPLDNTVRWEREDGATVAYIYGDENTVGASSARQLRLESQGSGPLESARVRMRAFGNDPFLVDPETAMVETQATGTHPEDTFVRVQAGNLASNKNRRTILTGQGGSAFPQIAGDVETFIPNLVIFGVFADAAGVIQTAQCVPNVAGFYTCAQLGGRLRFGIGNLNLTSAPLVIPFFQYNGAAFMCGIGPVWSNVTVDVDTRNLGGAGGNAPGGFLGLGYR